MKEKVVVVGAGLSGLAAVKELLEDPTRLLLDI